MIGQHHRFVVFLPVDPADRFGLQDVTLNAMLAQAAGRLQSGVDPSGRVWIEIVEVQPLGPPLRLWDGDRLTRTQCQQVSRWLSQAAMDVAPAQH